jgi:extradiol dioxygenase family protein
MKVNKFEITLPSNSLTISHSFYQDILKAEEINRTDSTVRYKFYDHLLRICFIGTEFKPQEHCNHVDKYDVPVPHFGVVLLAEEFHQLSERLTQAKVEFII